MDTRIQTAVMLILSCCFVAPAIGEQSAWLAHSIKYTDWEEVSKECDEWNPSKDNFDWGQPLRQSQSCMVTNTRYRKFFERNKYNNEQRERKSERKMETRLLKKALWRTTSGSFDRIVGTEKTTEWSGWYIEPESTENCVPMTTGASQNVDLNQAYQEVSMCNALASRAMPIYQYWLSGKTTRDSDNEAREVNPNFSTYQSTIRLGEKDRWLAPENQYAGWEDDGDVDCPVWSSKATATAESKPWGEKTLLYRTCRQKQVRSGQVISKSISGKVNKLESLSEERISDVERSITITGKQDYIKNESWVLAQRWASVPGELTCIREDMSDSVKWEVLYTQPYICEDKLEQRYHDVIIYASGKKTVNEKRSEFKSIKYMGTLVQIGNRDELLDDSVDTRETEWTTNGGLNCGIWSPSVNSVGNEVVFTQTRICSQTQEKYIERLSRWTSGDRWVASEQDSRIVRTMSTRNGQGLQLQRIVFENLGVLIGPSQKKVSNGVLPKDINRYDRLRVELDVDGTPDTVETKLVGPGLEITLPILSKNRHVFFFSLKDYNIEESGEWQMLFFDNRESGDERRISVELTFEETRN
jgi:hypothetical protein